jgi:hypothetical protein
VIAVLAVWAVVGVVLFAAAVAFLALVGRVTSLRQAVRLVDHRLNTLRIVSSRARSYH